MSYLAVPPQHPPPDDSLGGHLLAINGALAATAVVIVLLRTYVRAFVLQSFKTDDWIMLVAMLCGIGVLICWIGKVSLGVGRHFMFITPESYSAIMHWQFFASIIIMVGISLVKLSIAFVLLRFVETKHFRRLLWFMVAFLVAFTIACGGTLVFACIPVQASWDFSLAKSARCFSINRFAAIGSFNTSINIITDVIFVILPIPVIWRLNLPKRPKVSLIFILSLGVFACVASMVKLNYQVKIAHEKDPLRRDSFNLWNSVELYTGIIAACLPSLRTLFNGGVGRSRRSGHSYPSSAGRAAYIPYTDCTASGKSNHVFNKSHGNKRSELMLSASTGERVSSSWPGGHYDDRGYAMTTFNHNRRPTSFDGTSFNATRPLATSDTGTLGRIKLPSPIASPVGRVMGSVDTYAGIGIDSGRWETGNRKRANSDDSTMEEPWLPHGGILKTTDIEIV